MIHAMIGGLFLLAAATYYRASWVASEGPRWRRVYQLIAIFFWVLAAWWIGR